MRLITLSIIFAVCTDLVYSQGLSEDIRVNQIGYLPSAEKLAVVVSSSSTEFKVFREDKTREVFSGSLTAAKSWSQSGEMVRIADFSELKYSGKFVLYVSDKGYSHPFEIKEGNFTAVTKASIKAFYFNRASMALEEAYAGVYKRPAGHPDDKVVVLPSAASSGRPAGTVISTPYGWYDAGDYNKYIVNSGISTFSLLAAYERFPELYDTLKLNIPESSNNIPDILDEAYWNIRWMATMQDPADGGVYNKTTNANFDGFVMPNRATAARYVVAKGTAATLDFAAIMAMSARIYKTYYPEFANECLTKAELAWNWAKANSNVPFNNPGSEGGYPAVVTGGYGDNTFTDELFWAASELYITTQKSIYYKDINLNLGFNLPGWPNVQTLGILSLAGHRKSLPTITDTTKIKKILVDLANGFVTYRENTSPYKIPNNAFHWGSNSVPANQGMILLSAFLINPDKKYFDAALSAFDYLLGRNATTYCFVTGYGSKYPKKIHHRPSGADGIAEPIPGFLAGGPNPGNTYDCGNSSYPTTIPARCFIDEECSYSTNEIAINWNAPLVFLSGAIQTIYDQHYYTPIEILGLDTPVSVNVTISPIPAQNEISIKFAKVHSRIELTVFSIEGKLLLSKAYQTESTLSFDASGLENGVYLLRIKTDDNEISRKIVIRR